MKKTCQDIFSLGALAYYLFRKPLAFLRQHFGF